MRSQAREARTLREGLAIAEVLGVGLHSEWEAGRRKKEQELSRRG